MSIADPHNGAGQEAADQVGATLAAERLMFFSDAVLAIALTLLALELPVPAGHTNAEMLNAVWDDRGDYLAFLVSFVVIAAHWIAHNRVFRYVIAVNSRLTLLGTYWLMMQVLTPFATKVITGDGAFEVRFIFYALVQTLAFLLFTLMVLQIRKHHLYHPDTPPMLFVNSLWRSGLLMASFLVSIPLSFVTGYAYVCWLIAPALRPVTTIVLRRRAERHPVT